MRFGLIGALVLVAGCDVSTLGQAGPNAGVGTGAGNLENACPAAQYQGLVGQRYAGQNFGIPAAQLRVIRPGQAVTSDYSPERMTVSLDNNGKITEISCG